MASNSRYVAVLGYMALPNGVAKACKFEVSLHLNPRESLRFDHENS